MTQQRSLAVQAFDGWDIPNGIEPDPTAGSVQLARDALALHIAAAVTPCGAPTGRYNCHGLVFASRRTNVDGTELPVDIRSLLHRDGYRRIDGTPQPGDIAAYARRHHPGEAEGKIDHTGFVVYLDQFHAVFVRSMWGCIGEFVHNVNSSPYNDLCDVEYWRLRL